MIVPGKKVVLFPVETVVRELDFRLLLGAYCARADTQIIIGKQSLLQQLLARLRHGLFVGKNLRLHDYQQCKLHNFRTVQLHEEGAIYEGQRENWEAVIQEFLGVDHFEAEDYVCAWGEFQANCYRKRNPKCLEHIVVTGHPRFELCRPKYRLLYESEVQALRQQFGRIILFNTNFICNDAKGMGATLQLCNVKPEERERRTFFIDQCCNSSVKWARFIQLINHLSNQFPEFHIVVRPHPSENLHRYTSLLNYVPRVTVLRSGTLQAWLLASEALIHDGCTTGIEAYLAGLTVINFRPVSDERFDILLPTLVSWNCATEEEVGQLLRRVGSGSQSLPPVPPADAVRVKELINNFDPREDAFEKVARVIDEVLEEVPPTVVTGPGPLLGLHRMQDALANPLRRCHPAYQQKLLRKPDRGYEKFPPLQREQIQDRVRLIRQITGRQVRMQFHTTRLLSIHLDPS